MNAERRRLDEAARKLRHWRRWGPYLSDRAWGTVREDYSPYGTAWDWLPFEHAHLKAYRWGEDGIGGISDNHQRICFALALWNGRDPILKERLFGLDGNTGNHGEDAKELYYYLDSTPTHSYMKCLYKYPQAEFPYAWLLEENNRRNRHDPEFELIDTGIFDGDRYFDVFVEYAKAEPEDLLVRITIHNRGAESALLHVLPTVWFRNTWAWNRESNKPELRLADPESIMLSHPAAGDYRFWADNAPQWLFTDNEINTSRLYSYESNGGHYKDAFHRYLVDGQHEAVRKDHRGTKACAWYSLFFEPHSSREIRLRLSEGEDPIDFEQVFADRISEADVFYSFASHDLSEDARRVQRQAFAGLLWSKQFYHYVIEDWLRGDTAHPQPPAERLSGRNSEWTHLYADDVLSMPDKWEYPWFAAWDASFHMIPMAVIDADWAKRELGRFLREWYMHPNGQIPAYEWAFADVNPPVHAWASWRVFKIDAKMNGEPDWDFLESVFHKLLMNFTWWVNRKDAAGDNIFEGGFLGLDNIGVFDRSKPLPTGGFMEQSDGTSWMAMYCLNMLRIALELAQRNPVYEDIASKFFEHFLYISSAMNSVGGKGLWDEEDGFFYDRLRFPDGRSEFLKVRSMVGLIPLFAVDTIELDALEKLPGFKRRMDWFVANRPDLCSNIHSVTSRGMADRRLLAVCPEHRLGCVLRRMLDESEFLSQYGIRSLSRHHRDNPYVFRQNGSEWRVDYQPAESNTGLFGGNSNWRGPVWFPVNYLIIEALQKFHHYFGADFEVEFPTGSGRKLTLGEVAAEISRRLSHLFLRQDSGERPVFGGSRKMQDDPHFRDHVLFYEYFHGDTGAGLGASHQTGWTALVAKLLQQSGE